MLPYLSNFKKGAPHTEMFWRFWTQTAVRSGNYKYLQAGKDKAFLYDLDNDPNEKNNIISKNPRIAKRLHESLQKWTKQLIPAGIPQQALRAQEVNWYNFYFDQN